ncbi:MAG: FAD-binding and (Fe-S)-binding domain-containing protein [Bacteroidia bacterium]
MSNQPLQEQLNILQASLDGELHTGTMMRTLYATDASVYREMPLAVAIPHHEEDIRQLIHFARTAGTSLIPRTAGTSLAGQCVGDGIVVDTSRFLNKILEVDKAKGTVRVQPGVVRDELNRHLKAHGLFFGPNTSTANRAMIGGMVGNNSCGSTSIVYGTTRDHVLELKVLLSDGSEVVFGPVSPAIFEEKTKQQDLEGAIYREIETILSNEHNQQTIREEFPKAEVQRRNTGYAIDVLLASAPFTENGETLNLGKLIAGSEGTLCMITEITLQCDPLPPTETGMMCIHFDNIDECLKAVVIMMEHKPFSCEMMDKIVMDCTKGNRMYAPYRFFMEGDPAAVIMLEFAEASRAEVNARFDAVEKDLKAANMGYAYPRVYGANASKVAMLRKAGLGLLANVEGDAKPVAVIEDTAVQVQDLPAYIEEFAAMMKGYKQEAVIYAHAGAGELHLRPILDLKKKKDREDFRGIGRDTAVLVKKYGGSLSGEHGDGRVRAEFIPIALGEKNYELLRRVKYSWDPSNIFNPGKIVDAPPMDESLRYDEDQETVQFDTVFNFDETGGILRAAEKCNGSGDCRKLPLSGGTMCPSYMASRNEKDTTRARANILREFLTRSDKANRFDHEEIKEVMDLCLSCKGCASECPSNVDVASLKAEFLHQYYQEHGVPFRARMFANFAPLNEKLGMIWPAFTNAITGSALTAPLVKSIMGVAPKRPLPKLYKHSLKRWYKKEYAALKPTPPIGKLYFFFDEFINLNDVKVGIAAITLLARLGYDVMMVEHPESGRAALSKGVLPMAGNIARKQVAIFEPLLSEDTPLVGVEPSTILGFRDEYPRLVNPGKAAAAKAMAKHTFIIEEFLQQEVEKGNITAAQFDTTARAIKVHGHCHQKALSSVQPTLDILSLPQGNSVELIPSGCCGMAGSFGYEKEHYELSMQVGELVLFPAIREAAEGTIIAAPGTSCRHQIDDALQVEAQHPVEILLKALLPED